MKHLTTFTYILLLVFSCNSKNNSHPPDSKHVLVNGAINPVAINSEFSAEDPFFIESTDTVSKYGPWNITRNILQDKNGIIWLATWQGIINFDGNLFTNVTLKEKLRHFHTFSILEEKNGMLWFGSIGGGVYRYDGKVFTNITTSEGLVGDRVTCMMQDKNGNIWFGTDEGVSCFDGKIFINYTISDSLCNNSVNSIVQDKTGTIWFGTGHGVSTFSNGIFSDFKKNSKADFGNVRSIIEDKKGNIWIGGEDGLVFFNGKPPKTIMQNFVGYIFEDSEGMLWISASAEEFSGITRNAPGAMALYKYDPSKTIETGLTTVLVKGDDNDMQVFGVTEDTEGNFWIGVMPGIIMYDGKTLHTFSKEEVSTEIISPR